MDGFELVMNVAYREPRGQFGGGMQKLLEGVEGLPQQLRRRRHNGRRLDHRPRGANPVRCTAELAWGRVTATDAAEQNVVGLAEQTKARATPYRLDCLQVEKDGDDSSDRGQGVRFSDRKNLAEARRGNCAELLAQCPRRLSQPPDWHVMRQPAVTRGQGHGDHQIRYVLGEVLRGHHQDWTSFGLLAAHHDRVGLGNHDGPWLHYCSPINGASSQSSRSRT